MALHIGRDAVTGAQRIIGESDDSNRFRALKQISDGIRLRQRSHDFLHLYFLFASSIFCLYIFNASLRMVSDTSLLAEIFLRSCTSRFFINPRPRSSGVRGLAQRLRTTM